MKLSLVFLLLFLCSACANDADKAFARNNRMLVDRIIVPHYQVLAMSATSLHSDITHYCQGDESIGLDDIDRGYHQTMDAWQSVQWLRTGPSDNRLSHYRFQLWPDKNGTGARQIRKMLHEMDLDKLEETRFRKGSVAVQGLPAMERLIFDRKSGTQPFLVNGTATFRCYYLQAIAYNLEAISTELEKSWNGYYRKAIFNAGPGNEIFSSPVEPTGEFLSQISLQLEFILKLKLQSPLGLLEGKKKVRLKQSESWRSERSITNVLQNLQVLHDAYKIVLLPHVQSEELITKLEKLWESTIDRFSVLPNSMRTALSDHEKSLLDGLEKISLLSDLIANELSADIGIPIGFNSLDGD